MLCCGRERCQKLLSIIFLGLSLIFSRTNSNAQPWFGNIDTLQVIPVSPSSNDTVKVVCNSVFPSSACMLINEMVFVNDTIITVAAIHLHGGYNAICYTSDTILLGNNMPPGNYTVYYNLTDNILGIIDTDTLQFNIQQPSGLLFNQIEQEIRIVPNPFRESFAITSVENKFENATLKISNIFGKLILSRDHIDLGSHQSNTFDLSGMASGVYLLEITFKNSHFSRRILKY